MPIVPQSYIINIGDMLKRWTNDYWESSMHRVANPPHEKAADSRRQSLIFFFHPNYDTVLDGLPTPDGAKNKYPPITVGDDLMAKVAKMKNVEVKS